MRLLFPFDLQLSVSHEGLMVDAHICDEFNEKCCLQVSKEFMMSPNKLHLECSLDKELYYHGETISVNVHIQASHIITCCVNQNCAIESAVLTVFGKIYGLWEINEAHAFT